MFRLTLFLTAVLIAIVLLATPPAHAAGRIVNGKPAKQGQFPTVVGITIHDSWVDHQYPSCTGVAISPTKVLTAAHCSELSERPELFTVHAGTARLVNTTEYSVRRIDIPTRWYESDFAWDVMVLHLTSPLPFRTYPVIARPNTPARTVAAGFGVTEDDSLPGRLRFVELATPDLSMSTQVCQDADLTPLHHICTPIEAGGGDTCFGDSGGPLFQQGRLIGLTSFGPEECGTTYAAYAHLFTYRKWIDGQRSPGCRPEAREPVTNLRVSNRLLTWRKPCGEVAVYRVSNGAITRYIEGTSFKAARGGKWRVSAVRPDGLKSPDVSISVR